MNPPVRTFWGWTIALIGSALLNISLFGLMPGLIQTLPDRPAKLNDLKQIQVIRIKRPPPLRKEPRKINTPRPLKPPATVSGPIITPRPVTLKPFLAFELNPKLPAASQELIMPNLMQFSMAPSVLKSHYTLDELDFPLTALVKIPPIYPIRATRSGIEGFVTVEFLVTEQGIVAQIKIIEAEPKTIFDKNVINCVAQWKFTPGTVDGIPVATMARTTIRFKLEKQ